MAWYKTGTIAVSGTTVTGTGTNFTDNKMGIGPGQAVLIPGAGTVKMYEIASVDSATKLTLTSSAGTIAAGQAYAIMSFYTDSIPDFARRLSAQLSYYQSQMDGWQQIMTGTGSISITAPDGTQVTISSFKKLTDDVAGKLDKSQNLNDVANKATARTNLGLGTSSTVNTGTSEGNVILAGSSMGTPTDGYRFFQAADAIAGAINVNDAIKAGLFPNLINGSEAINAPASGYYYLLNFVRGSTGAVQQFALPYATSATSPGRMFFRGKNGSTISAWAEFYTTVNTTKASDGTLKAASPVARIVKSQEDNQRTDIAEEGFNWCGCGTANGEAEGVRISRLDIGVYVLTGSAGLASEGWQLLPPMDPGGMGELGVVEAEETESGGITVRLYKRKYMLGEDGDIVKTKGAQMDVPANSWIDIRLDMPENSIWNQTQAAAQEQMEETGPDSQADQPDAQS